MKGTRRTAAGWRAGVGCAVVVLWGGCATGGQVASSPRAPPEPSMLERLTGDCESGKAHSCGVLGVLYVKGLGVEKDERRAAALWEKACEGGVAEGCYGLGRLYVQGLGVEKDLRRASALFRQACSGGLAHACQWQ